MSIMTSENLDMDYSKYDFKDSTEMYVYTSKKGLSREVVEEISRMKGEPKWMLDFRLRSYDIFMKKPMPNWGGDLKQIDFNNIYYYAKASEKTEKVKRMIGDLIDDPSSHTSEDIESIKEHLMNMTMPIWRHRASEFRERKMKRSLVLHV